MEPTTTLSDLLEQIRLLKQSLTAGELDFWTVNEAVYTGTGFIRQYRPNAPPLVMGASPEAELVAVREIESLIVALGGTVPAAAAEAGNGEWIITLLPILIDLLAKWRKNR